MKLIDVFFLKISNNKILSFFIVITGLCTTINAFKPFLEGTLFTPINFFIFLVTLFFIIRTTASEVLSKKEQGFVSSDYYSNNEIRIAKIASILNYLLLIYALIFGGKEVYKWSLSKDQEKKACESNFKKTGLLIANFSKHDDDESFSSALYGRLNADLQYIDTINLKQLNKYITESHKDYLDTIKSTFQENCSKSGLIVFGNRLDQKQFNCRIYSFNFLNFNTKNFLKTNDNKIIYIQNPNLIDFTVEYETNVISKFIYGLLYYHSGNFSLSSQSILDALQKNKNPNNTQFISICHLFIGNNFAKQGDTLKAIEEYKNGIAANPQNEYLHYNIATLYNLTRNVTIAFDEYNIAQNLNPNFKNPLKKVRTSSLFKRYHIAKTVEKLDTIGNKVTVPLKWDEHCYTIFQNQKYGVINNRGDTIVKCIYDGIESMPYKNADCFIVRVDKKFGAIIHVHHDYGFALHNIPVEYSTFTIKNVIFNCLDNTDLN